jgi:hypothetical protein
MAKFSIDENLLGFYKTLSSGRLSLTMPEWSAPAEDEHSNFYLLMNPLEYYLDDYSRSIQFLRDNTRTTFVSLMEPGHVFRYEVPAGLVFNFEDEANRFNYITPEVSGDDRELYEVPYRSQDAFLYALPNTIEATQSIGAYNQFVFEEEDLVNPQEIEVYEEFNPVIEVVDSSEQFFTVTNNGSYEVKYVLIKNKQFPRINFKLDVVRPGIYQVKEYLPPGKYIVTTNLDNCTLKIFPWGFLEEGSNFYEGTVLGRNFRYVKFKINEEDNTYLDCLAYKSNSENLLEEAIVIKSYKLDSPIISIAFIPGYPWIVGLHANAEQLKIYSLYDTPAKFVYLNNDRYLLSLYAEKINYKVGDVILLKTRRDFAFMTMKFRGIRLFYKFGDEESSKVYLNKEGTVVEARDAWVSTTTSNGDWYENRWEWPIEEAGDYKFYIEGMLQDTGEAVVISELILQVPKKNSLVTLSDIPLSETEELYTKIGYSKEGYLIITDDIVVYKLELGYDCFYIDYKSYSLFTRSAFDVIEVTV